jgi:hypothetical protein
MMSDDFKRQLQDYADGKLTGNDKEQFELELEKMEAYQAYLGELMGNDEARHPLVDGSAYKASTPIKEASLLRRSKWRARIQTALTAIGILITFTLISAILTGLFYGLGNRSSLYQDVVSSAIALTRPNLTVSGGSNSNAYFTMDYKGNMKKKIGDSEVSVGDFQLKFLLGWPMGEQTTWHSERNNSNASLFLLSGSDAASSNQDWATLEKLPEGTVTEAFVSLDKRYTTDELLQKFNGKNMTPVWFAAYTGQERKLGDAELVMNPVGFPAYPLWHAEDMQVTSRSEEKRGWFGKTVMESSISPGIQTYGDGSVRDKNFLDTLHLLQKYPTITNRLAPWLPLEPTITYLEANGVKLYGVVVTGPTKELLKLKEEQWVSSIRVGEVRLWNWNNR